MDNNIAITVKGMNIIQQAIDILYYLTAND